MNANAPLTSILKVETHRQEAKVGFIIGADLGDIRKTVEINLGSENAMMFAHALRQAERHLATGKLGNINCRPSICIEIDIDLNRGGIVLTAYLESGEHYFFLHGSSTINRCVDALLASALKLQTPNREAVTWH